MMRTNRVIWDQMDVLRDGDISDAEYTKLCRECIATNDVRFRIKNKINLISNSDLREQKSYKVTRYDTHIDNDDEDDSLIERIRQLSYIYDEVHIISSKDISRIKDAFHYDNTIFCGALLPAKLTLRQSRYPARPRCGRWGYRALGVL